MYENMENVNEYMDISNSEASVWVVGVGIRIYCNAVATFTLTEIYTKIFMSVFTAQSAGQGAIHLNRVAIARWRGTKVNDMICFIRGELTLTEVK